MYHIFCTNSSQGNFSSGRVQCTRCWKFTSTNAPAAPVLLEPLDYIGKQFGQSDKYVLAIIAWSLVLRCSFLTFQDFHLLMSCQLFFKQVYFYKLTQNLFQNFLSCNDFIFFVSTFFVLHSGPKRPCLFSHLGSIGTIGRVLCLQANFRLLATFLARHQLKLTRISMFLQSSE